MQDPVDILLATYQGESYLEEQLQSLMQQSYSHFHIFIRDDGSTDQTLSIIESFRQAYPDRISVIPSIQRLGVKGNFSELMGHSQAPYIMFCDQDDVWLPHKIEVTLQKMKKLEDQEGAEIPLIVHTDLQVVQADLALTAPSFWRYSNINPSLTSLNRLLVKNSVTGCAMLMNRTLLRLAHPIPQQSMMHDWWIALVAALFGKIDYLKESTILYRQHGKNDTGAKKFSLWKAIENKFYKKRPSDWMRKYAQAQHLLERYSPLLNASQKQILKAFCSLQDLSGFRKMTRQVRYRFLPNILSKSLSLNRMV
jgi:glycosyltransferase involved in cell wall biosynthesis